MSILVKGMDMPKDCVNCQFEFCGVCVVNGKDVEEFEHTHSTVTKDPDCPLLELPPHGRLIDADAYSERMKARQDNCATWRDEAKENYDDELYARADGALGVFIEAKLTLDKMPTIIEAEGE